MGLGHLVSSILLIVDIKPDVSTLKLYSDNRGASVGSVYLSKPFLHMSPREFYIQSLLRSFKAELHLRLPFLRSEVYD